MNLSKFLKGTITIGELENLPNRYIQVIYKEYDTTMRNKELREANEAEQVQDEIEETMGG